MFHCGNLLADSIGYFVYGEERQVKTVYIIHGFAAYGTYQLLTSLKQPSMYRPRLIMKKYICLFRHAGSMQKISK